MKTSRDLWKEQRELDKEIRDLKEKLFEPYEEEYRAKKLEIMQACGDSEKGHNFRFNDFGPTGLAWYFCSICGKSKVEGYE